MDGARKAAVDAYFARYEAVANSFDPDAGCGLYTGEFLGGGQAGVACGRNDGTLREAFVQREARFRALGFRQARVMGVQATALDERYTLAKVDWHMRFEKQPGQPLDFRFFITYILHDASDGPKAAFWISHEDELQVMREAGLLVDG